MKIFTLLFFGALAPAILSPPAAQPASPAPPPAPSTLVTRWAKEVSRTNPLSEYPRPQLVRKDWKSLNGPWDYAVTGADAAAPPPAYQGTILVPFPIESQLSGVRRSVTGDQQLWYHRTFSVPATWQGQNLLLHFGAVDYQTTVFLNGQTVGDHTGGYDPFDFDITDQVHPGVNQMVVEVHDSTSDTQPIGKQRLKPGGIMYTSSTGIWQPVWMEPVPASHITGLEMTPDLTSLHLTVDSTGGDETVQAVALDGSRRVGAADGPAHTEIRIPVDHPHLWSPDDPHLYRLQVNLVQNGRIVDRVESYFGLRTISLGKDDRGITRPLLNGRFVFQMGVLDQGFWPDGIYTAPTDAALRYDLEMVKKLGFNLDRKHAKVERERWYYWADRLGVLVWQDMPQAFSDHLSDAAKQQFQTELQNLVRTHYNHPSIIVWTLFNEGWGQHDTAELAQLVREWDPTRLINPASGWNDVPGAGDIHDIHNYPAPKSPQPEPTRAAADGEFGGLGMRIPGHMWVNASWGYQGLFSTPWQLTERYQQYLKDVYGFVQDPGLSAAVYTQLTDVETESNGLMTYDRAVVKPDLRIVAAANQGHFLPLPPNPHPSIMPTSEDEPETWSYITELPEANWNQPRFDARTWKTGPGGFGANSGGVNTAWDTPDLWLRREVTLPENLPENLNFLVNHAGDVEIYINGVLAAQAPGFSRGYLPVPMTPEGRAAIKPGVNVISVHVHRVPPAKGDRRSVDRQFVDVGIGPAE